MDAPRFASALSTDPDFPSAAEHCMSTLREHLGGAPDLVLAFASPHHGPELESLPRRLGVAGNEVLAGCMGAAIVGGPREVEREPALSVFAARLPGCAVRIQHVEAHRASSARTWSFSGRPEVREPGRSGLLLFGDPYSFPAADYLALLGRELPMMPVVGGMASGGEGPGMNRMFAGSTVHGRGAVAVVIEGAVELHAAVSQGCRPIGEPLVVTACRENVILKLGGRGAARRMIELLEALSPPERALFQRGAFVGIAIDPTKSRFGASDLLVRNVVGLDPDRDVIAIAASSLRPGQTIHFMVRDAASATAELEEVLARRSAEWGADPNATGGLLFTCGGRGTHMFSAPDHDAGAIQGALGPELALAGFFANGEIGPVGGAPFLHGFTASMAFLRARTG